ncbi:hypothetical protein AB9F45_39655, partial [Rhizobium leguminosarum]
SMKPASKVPERKFSAIEETVIRSIPLGRACISRSYLERRGHPRQPGELQNHACIGWRQRPDTAPYRWEFTENDRDFD